MILEPVMRVASFVVLVLLTRAAVAAPIVPDRETEIVAIRASGLARLGLCDRAIGYGTEVAERDAAYYRQLVATDDALFRCLKERDTERRYHRWRERDPRAYTHRLGLDGMASLGPVMSLGGWLRYEHASGFVARLAGLRGQVLESEDDGFDALVGHVGYRHYWGGFYLYAEAGGIALHHRAHAEPFGDEIHPASWSALPSFAAGLGGKVGRADLALSLLVPAMSVGLSLGFDFARL